MLIDGKRKCGFICEGGRCLGEVKVEPTAGLVGWTQQHRQRSPSFLSASLLIAPLCLFSGSSHRGERVTLLVVLVKCLQTHGIKGWLLVCVAEGW